VVSGEGVPVVSAEVIPVDLELGVVVAAAL